MTRFIEKWNNFYNTIKTNPERSGLSEQEAYTLYVWVYATRFLSGDIAEFGVYKGWSSKIICKANVNNKLVYLFDTFNGMPLHLTDAKLDVPYFNTGKHHNLTSLDNVKVYLSDYKNIKFVKGLFSETIQILKKKQFSFVHLDCDISQSILEGLKYFYPRLSKGGVLICHNYNTPKLKTEGVKQAFKEYFSNLDKIIELNETQGMVIK